MGIEFRGVCLAPLHDLTVSAPSGAVIGIIGEKGAGKGALLRLASGAAKPESGEAVVPGNARYFGPLDAVEFFATDILLLEHSLAFEDAFARTRALADIARLRRSGSTILIVSHELDLLQSICDEVWWLDAGSLRGRGDPGEVIEAYRKHIAEKVRIWGATQNQPFSPAVRRGDGRAEILALETLGADGKLTAVWQSGEQAAVRVTVRYRESIEEPVIGIMIRTRIGLAVYGTNTELEKIRTGTCAPGTRLGIEFAFRCDLCPGEYTITAASHDADGTAHDWADDALAINVVDSRYTAGVANLRAKLTVEKF